jgi:hypothetical protein
MPRESPLEIRPATGSGNLKTRRHGPEEGRGAEADHDDQRRQRGHCAPVSHAAGLLFNGSWNSDRSPDT